MIGWIGLDRWQLKGPGAGWVGFPARVVVFGLMTGKKKHAKDLTRNILGEEQNQDINAFNHHHPALINNSSLHLFTPLSPASILVDQPSNTIHQVSSKLSLKSTMVAFPPVGTSPYGTSPKSARSSTTDTPKLDAAQIENIFQQVNASKEQVPATSSSRFGWFSRQ